MEVEITSWLLAASQCKPGCLQCESTEVPGAALGNAVGMSPPQSHNLLHPYPACPCVLPAVGPAAFLPCTQGCSPGFTLCYLLG